MARWRVRRQCLSRFGSANPDSQYEIATELKVGLDGKIYMTDPVGQQVAVLSGGVTSLIEVTGTPIDLAVNPQNGHMYATTVGYEFGNVDGELTLVNVVKVVDLVTGGTVGTAFGIPFNSGISTTSVVQYSDMVVAADGSLVYVVNPFNDSIVVIDTATHQRLSPIPVERLPVRLR